MERMGTRVEVWLIAFDQTGLHLIPEPPTCSFCGRPIRKLAHGRWSSDDTFTRCPQNPGTDGSDHQPEPPGPLVTRDFVPGGSNPGWELDLLLDRRGVRDDVLIKHGTSNRWDETGQIDTFLVVLSVDGLVKARWPEAKTIRVKALLKQVGPPAPHPADEFPEVIRQLDVLLHGIRHLAFLKLFDASAFEAMPAVLRTHLEHVLPDLAKMQGLPRREAA